MLGNFIACLDAVLPIFLLLLLGYWAKCLGLLNRDDVKKLNKVMFRFFMPVMLFYNVYSSDLSLAVQPKLILYALVCTLLIFLLALPAVSRWEPVRSRRGVIVQGLFRSNVVVIGLPVVESLMGAENVAPVVLLIATVVPFFNVLAVIVLEYYGGEHTRLSHLLLDILKNPLILGSAAGLLALAVGLKLPLPLETLTRQMAQTASPMLLFLLGAFLEPALPPPHAHPRRDAAPGGAAGLSGRGPGLAPAGLRLLHGHQLLHHGPADGRGCGAGGQHRGRHQRALLPDAVFLVLPLPVSGPFLRQRTKKERFFPDFS